MSALSEVSSPFFVLAGSLNGLEPTTKTRLFCLTKCNTTFSTYNKTEQYIFQ